MGVLAILGDWRDFLDEDWWVKCTDYYGDILFTHIHGFDANYDNPIESTLLWEDVNDLGDVLGSFGTLEEFLRFHNIEVPLEFYNSEELEEYLDVDLSGDDEDFYDDDFEDY